MGRVGILGLIIWVGRPGIGLGLAGRVGIATCIYFQTFMGAWGLGFGVRLGGGWDHSGQL